MASVGRGPKGDRDKPAIPNVITATGDSADTPGTIDGTITQAKPTGFDPPVANTITSAKGS